MCKIAILEDYTLFCSGIRPVIEHSDEIEIVVEAKQLNELIPKIKQYNPDLLIIDIIHCNSDGIKILKRLQRMFYKLPILLVVNKDFSIYFEEYIALGVNGIVCTSMGTEELINAVQSIRKGQEYFPTKVWLLLKDHLRTKRKDILPERELKAMLSQRELSILRLFCKGLTYKEIGGQLNISPRTVETHKKNISTKLQIHSTAEMVEYALQNNLI